MSNFEVKKAKYGYNNNLGLVLFEEGEVYGNLTVNLEGFRDSEYIAFLDVNNADDYLSILEGKYEVIGEQKSGFVTFPLVRFDKEFIDNLEPLA